MFKFILSPRGISLILSLALLPANFANALEEIARIGLEDVSRIDDVTPKQLVENQEFVGKIMGHDSLYKFLNTVFSDQLIIPPEKRQEFGWPEKAKGLSESQLLFLLSELKEYWGILQRYIEVVHPGNEDDPDIIAVREDLKNEFLKKLKIEDTLRKLANLNDPSVPMLLGGYKGKPTVHSMRLFVNHPSLSNPQNSKSKLVPADNLKQLVVNFIRGARYSVTFNVFEFNLLDVAQALVDQSKKGVRVLGGIDIITVEGGKDANKSVADLFANSESENLKVVLVRSVGLNHQKIIVRDAGTSRAEVLLLSGNFTQSCIGPEGDLVNIPAALRPKESIPNTNNAVLVRGQIPALIAENELKKTLLKKLVGQSQYPISGSYLFEGPKDPRSGKSTWLKLAFSPNGGFGDLNRDVLSSLVLSTKGDIWAMQFAFSSPQIKSAIVKRLKAAKEKGSPIAFLGLGDPPFAMREFSVFIELSGIQRAVDKVYSFNRDLDIFKIFNDSEVAELQKRIRVNPMVYGTFHRNVEGLGSLEMNAKLHHKVLIFPSENIVTAGTSFNPSASAESNQEQIVIISDPAIARRMMGAFMYLHSKSPYSVAQYAAIKNSRLASGQDTGDEEGEGDAESSALAVPAPQ